MVIPSSSYSVKSRSMSSSEVTEKVMAGNVTVFPNGVSIFLKAWTCMKRDKSSFCLVCGDCGCGQWKSEEKWWLIVFLRCLLSGKGPLLLLEHSLTKDYRNKWLLLTLFSIFFLGFIQTQFIVFKLQAKSIEKLCKPKKQQDYGVVHNRCSCGLKMFAQLLKKRQKHMKIDAKNLQKTF